MLEEARAFAGIIAAKSRRALVLAKEALNGLEPRDVDHGYRFEQGFTLEMYLHEDSQKARDAFVKDKNTAQVLKPPMALELQFTPAAAALPRRGTRVDAGARAGNAAADARERGGICCSTASGSARSPRATGA